MDAFITGRWSSAALFDRSQSNSFYLSFITPDLQFITDMSIILTDPHSPQQAERKLASTQRSISFKC